MDPAPYIFASNTHEVIKDTYQKLLNDSITICYFLRATKNTNLVINSMMLSRKKIFKC